MLHLSHTFHQHIIHIYFYVSPNLWTKHMVNQLLVDSPCILQPKWHYFVTKETLAHYIGCLLLVCFVHLNLIVP